MNWALTLMSLGTVLGSSIVEISFGGSTQPKFRGYDEKEREITEEKLKIFFKDYDIDVDGYFSLDEYLAGVKRFDTDGNGLLDQDEFIEGVESVGCSKLAVETLTGVFQYWSSYGGTRKPKVQLSLPDIEFAFHHADINNTGKLTEEEWVSYWIKEAKAGVQLFFNTCGQ